MKYDKIKRILIVVITITYMAIGFTYQYRYDDETENIEKINISGTYQETEDDLPVAFKSFEDIRSDGYKQLIVKGHFPVPRNQGFYHRLFSCVLLLYISEQALQPY